MLGNISAHNHTWLAGWKVFTLGVQRPPQQVPQCYWVHQRQQPLSDPQFGIQKPKLFGNHGFFRHKFNSLIIKILFYDKLNRKSWRKNPKLVNYANKLDRKKLDLCNRSGSPVAYWLVSRPCHPWVLGLKSGGSSGFLTRVFLYKAFVFKPS